MSNTHLENVGQKKAAGRDSNGIPADCTEGNKNAHLFHFSGNFDNKYDIMLLIVAKLTSWHLTSQAPTKLVWSLLTKAGRRKSSMRCRKAAYSSRDN